jgi:hypothetical protein
MADPVSLDEYKAFLELSTDTSETDPELQMHLNGAVKAIEKRIGPILTRDYAERVRARNGAVTVNTTPLVELTSLTRILGAVEYDVATLDPDPSGVITRLTGTRLPDGKYDVEYTAGRGATASEDHKMAILYTAQHFWEMKQRQQNGRPGLFGEQEEAHAGAGLASAVFVYRGFALPRRALELISGDEVIGFA